MRIKWSWTTWRYGKKKLWPLTVDRFWYNEDFISFFIFFNVCWNMITTTWQYGKQFDLPECIVFDIMRILLAFSYFSTFSETRRYGPVRDPVPAEDFSLWLMLFLPFGQKKELIKLFRPIIGNFFVSSGNLGNF